MAYNHAGYKVYQRQGHTVVCLGIVTYDPRHMPFKWQTRGILMTPVY